MIVVSSGLFNPLMDQTLVNCVLFCIFASLPLSGIPNFVKIWAKNSKVPQRPILPGSYPPSTFGAGRLYCCVRYGNRCGPSAIVARLIDLLNYNCIKHEANNNDHATSDCFSIHFSVSVRIGADRDTCLIPQRTRLKMSAEATHTSAIIQNNIVYKLGSRPRSISTGQLHMLPYFHIQPIYLVVYQGP